MNPFSPHTFRYAAAALLVFASTAVRADVAGRLEADFSPNIASDYFFSFRALAVQPDGKIIVGGTFNRVNGRPSGAMARLSADGIPEGAATFAPDLTSNESVLCLAVQADGKILLVGNSGIRRLNPSGSSDTSFAPAFFDSTPCCIAMQPDGKILIGGAFSTINGQPRSKIARLNPDGTLEATATFSLGTGLEGDALYPATVFSVAVQQDGKIVIGGVFTSVDRQPRNGIARLLSDGSVESSATFNTGTGVIDLDAFPGFVNSVAVQSDGKILLTGYFDSVNGQARKSIARLNSDGSVESAATFNSGTGLKGGGGNSLAVQADGKILVAGDFTAVDEQPRRGIARLNPDGRPESTASFDPGEGANRSVSALALQADGRILLGGDFTSMDGQPRNHIARLRNDPARQTLRIASPVRVEWLRSGAAPEIENATFELLSPDGSSRGLLGAASRIAGGWELAGLQLPASGVIQARGRTTTGDFNGSSSVVQQIATFGVIAVPTVTAQIRELTTTSATIDAIVNPTNSATAVEFQIDGAFHFSQTLPPDGSAVEVTTVVNGLTSASTHAAIVSATNSVGTATATVNFTLLPMPEHAADPAFSGSVAGSFVRAIAVQPDGKTLIGGLFSTVDGEPRSNIARLNADGTLESTASFNPGMGPDARVNSIVVQPDGKILIGGFFTKVNGKRNRRIARLNADGSLESTLTFDTGLGADENVTSLALQADGKILVAGLFNSINGQPRQKIARLNADGSVESTTTFNAAADGPEIYCLAVQPDGKILLGGSFEVINNQFRSRIARLNADGTLESPSAFAAAFGETVFCIAVEPQGKILVGGDITYGNAGTPKGIARLNADGTLESIVTFNPGFGPDDRVNSIALQTDGKILIGGDFNFVNDQPRSKIARLNPNGTLESTASFNAGSGANDTVFAVAQDAVGKALIGGSFSTINLAAHTMIGRLGNDAAPRR